MIVEMDLDNPSPADCLFMLLDMARKTQAWVTVWQSKYGDSDLLADTRRWYRERVGQVTLGVYRSDSVHVCARTIDGEMHLDVYGIGEVRS